MLYKFFNNLLVSFLNSLELVLVNNCVNKINNFTNSLLEVNKPLSSIKTFSNSAISLFSQVISVSLFFSELLFTLIR